ncbi:putative exported protein [Pectobacterium atrosepticum SCRI1043]|uniref:Exported protein n=1 Tax=Pectobacterium atrosepticum (strain SCRI 1043 / ATCC BAA-672) TaxID=218491 RepID=Q6CZ69_PECAS|nr:putative exported protein [Pectobacterium atrosepticum SCRI1043]
MQGNRRAVRGAPLAVFSLIAPAVNVARPALIQVPLCNSRCWPFVIQHNVALREMGRRGGPQRVTHIMSAPVG